ncbi:MAG: hypothetical protein HND52_09300 [Ignavibacteriae bacterium]|nr:hypothetical protein [Ignavibacteriota bacterium]NOG98146.1 hypothetical protein [Ignavibacteriota bacterium]
MKIKYALLFVIIVLLAGALNAQQVYFCESVDDNGEPVNAKPQWKLDDGEVEVQILFDNGQEIITGSLWYLFVDKKYEHTFEPFDSKTIRIDDDKTWLTYEYTFEEEGEYDIYFMDLNRNKLASKKIKILKESTVIRKPTPTSQQRSFSSNYYSGIKLTYAERVISDKPVNERDYTSLSKFNGEIYTYLKHYKPLNTDTVYVEVWFKEPNWDEFSEFIESKKYRINQYWYDTFFRYKFDKVGVYKFMIYDKNYNLIISTRPVRVYE